MSRPPVLPLRTLALLALAATAPVRPASAAYCVHDVHELREALIEAAGSSLPLEFVRVREGHYLIEQGGALGLYLLQGGKTIEVSGGWTGAGGACSQRVLGASRTVIESATLNRVLDVNMVQGVSGNVIVLQDLTLRNPRGWYDGAACLDMTSVAGNQIALERLRFDDCRSTSTDVLHASALHIGGNGPVAVRNIAVTGGRGPGAAVSIGVHGGTVARIGQLTITGHDVTSSTPVVGGLWLAAVGSSDRIHLSNSVIARNTGAPAPSLLLGGEPVTVSLARVHYESLSGLPLANVAPGTGDPGFVAPGEGGLRPDSILVDSGVAAPEGGTGIRDVDGRFRVLGAAVDVGAIEYDDVLFRDGFD